MIKNILILLKRLCTAKFDPEISDTVKVTHDGAIIVDTAKLFKKPRMQKMMLTCRKNINVVKL